MRRAFHHDDNSEHHSTEEERVKSSLRSEEELDNICYILKHWGGTQKIEDDDR